MSDDAPYPPLRALPMLAVQWADLYRRVKIQETVFDLLTQEYEMARIEEAKSIPAISVIDNPSWPEKKSFPPRLIIMLSGMLLSAAVCFLAIIRRTEWSILDEHDARKHLLRGMVLDLKREHPALFRLRLSKNSDHEI